MSSKTTKIEICTIALDGRLDAVSAPALRTALAETIESGVVMIEIDLQHVEFVDSAGLAALVHAMKSCRSHGGDVTLVRPDSDAAYRVFELTKFDSVFEIRAAGQADG